MKTIQHLHSEAMLKVLGDPVRAAILRLLISRAATISQLGEILGKHPAQIRNHLMQLERLKLVELISIVDVKNYKEKYYRATARAFFVNLAVLPEPGPQGQIVVLGSDDLALNLLAELVSHTSQAPLLYTLPVGSLEGLIYLREGYCQISGCHLYDLQSGEYNLPFVRQLFTDQTMIVSNLAYRQQGFMVSPGNPFGLTQLDDLIRAGIRFVNRKPGTGTRHWLDQQLRQMGLVPAQIEGYHNEVQTHAEVAQTVADGRADIGLGIFALARKYELAFIPLFEERYDLVMPEEFFYSDTFSPVLKVLRSTEFRAQIETLGGYNTARTGEIITV